MVGTARAFVGREQELGTLVAALEGAAKGTGGLFLLRGEPGIGKSRTARELVAEARRRDLAIGIGFCVEGDAAPAYAPWTQALQGGAGAGALAERLVTASSAEAGSGVADADFESERFGLFVQIDAALREACQHRPHLLVLEDLHWADVDSLQLLHHVTRRLDDQGLVVLCTSRDEEPADPRVSQGLGRIAREAQSLPLGPLREPEVAALVASALQATPETELVREALRRSAGNPLFLWELLALVAMGSGDVSLAALTQAAVPPVLRRVIGQRLERLGAETRELLARAAVLGDPFELDVLAGLAGQPPDVVLRLLDPAHRERLIEPTGEIDGGFHLVHALMRDAMLAGISLAETAELHRRAAEVLETLGRDRTEAELARLAEHHRRGRTPGSARRAVECATLAAVRACEERALDHGVRHLRLALESLERTDEAPDAKRRRRCDLQLMLGDARSQLGERDEARDAYLEAGRLARELQLPELLGRAALGIVGRDEDLRGLPETATRWVELALAAIGEGDGAIRAALLSVEARLAVHRGQPERGEALAREGVGMAERIRNPTIWAFAAHALHQAVGLSGRIDERLELSQRIVEAARRGSSARAELLARQQRLTDLLHVGEIRAADEQLRVIEDLALDRGHPAFLWHAACLAAGRELRGGALDRAEQRIAAALALGREAGMRNAPALYAVQIFHLREEQGRLGELQPAMQDMVERNPQAKALALMVPLATLQAGDPVLTRATFEPVAARDFEDIPRDTDWLPVVSTCARIAAYLRDERRCRILLEKLAPYEGLCIVAAHGQYWGGSLAHYLALLEAVLGHGDAAREQFEAAIVCHRGAGAVPLLAHTLVEFGAFEAEQRRPEARAAYEEALALFRELGVPLFVDRTEAALAALPAGAREPAGRKARTAVAKARLAREGSHWAVEFAGRRVLVAHRKGLLDLATLLAAPSREIHALDLMAAESPARERTEAAPTEAEATSGAEPAALAAVDAEAIAQYRERLTELGRKREEAHRRNDLSALAALHNEVDWIESELQSAFGAGRGKAGEFSQKARKAVYNRVRAAIDAIAVVHPELGQHLRNSIQTGITCVYRPETTQEWDVEVGIPG